MAEFAAKIVAENGLDAERSGPIRVLPGRIEDLESLPVPQASRLWAATQLRGLLERMHCSRGECAVREGRAGIPLSSWAAPCMAHEESQP